MDVTANRGNVIALNKDFIYSTIRDRIVTLVYPPGEPLNERRLAEEFNASRTPIREVLRDLERQGLVEISPRRGTFVRHVDLARFREQMVVKAELEALAARLATGNMGAEGIARLHGILVPLDSPAVNEPLEPETLVRIDQDFHRALWEYAGNQYLTESLEALNNQVARVWYMYLRQTGQRMESNVRNLTQVLDAIRVKDAEGAATSMRAHIIDFFEAVREKVFSLD